MKKYHELKTLIIDGEKLNYFYTKEKRDVNGNSRFRVYMFCASGDLVIETIFKTYETILPDAITNFIKQEAEQ